MLNMYPTKTCINNSNTDHYSEFKTKIEKYAFFFKHKVEKDAKAYYLIINFRGCQRYPRELMPSVPSWFHSRQVHISTVGSADVDGWGEKLEFSSAATFEASALTPGR